MAGGNEVAPKALLQSQKLASALDTAIKVPFLPVRLGLDFILGLIPIAGDAAALLIAAKIILNARSLGMPKGLIVKMIRNSVIDFALGLLPLIGDIIDMFYQSNQKNVRLMEQWWVSQNKSAIDANVQTKLQAWSNSQ